MQNLYNFYNTIKKRLFEKFKGQNNNETHTNNKKQTDKNLTTFFTVSYVPSISEKFKRFFKNNNINYYTININISRLFFYRVWKILSHDSTPPRRSPVQNVTRVKFLRSYDARQKNPVSGIVDRLSVVYGTSERERNCFQRRSHRKNRFR